MGACGSSGLLLKLLFPRWLKIWKGFDWTFASVLCPKQQALNSRFSSPLPLLCFAFRMCPEWRAVVQSENQLPSFSKERNLQESLEFRLLITKQEGLITASQTAGAEPRPGGLFKGHHFAVFLGPTPPPLACVPAAATWLHFYTITSLEANSQAIKLFLFLKNKVISYAMFLSKVWKKWSENPTSPWKCKSVCKGDALCISHFIINLTQ